MTDIPCSIAATFKATLEKFHTMRTGIILPHSRLHGDFAFTFNGWHINRHAKADGLVPDTDAKKIRLLFDDGDMEKLDDCPYMARLSYSRDLTQTYRFCAFLYPRQGETVDQVKDWAETRGFEHISVLNDGNALPRWDHAHRLEALGG